MLAKSSNIGAIQIGQRLGQQRLYDYMSKYGFGQPTGLGLPGEDPGVLPPVDHWSNTSLPTIAFGQGISVNALQVASVYSTIANGGVRMTPRLIASTTGAERRRARPTPPSRAYGWSAPPSPTRSRTCSSRSRPTRAPRRRPGSTATGSPARPAPPSGPTGTAATRGYTATFVGFAPADNPQLVVEVVLQNPQNGHFGGVVAAPVFHDVMSFALAAEGIAPTGTTPPMAKLTAD